MAVLVRSLLEGNLVFVSLSDQEELYVPRHYSMYLDKLEF